MPMKRTAKTFTSKRARRKTVRRMPGKLVNNLVHRFRRNGSALTTITGNVAYAPYQQATNIQLAFTQNYTELTALFDQYKIDYVIQKFYLTVDPSAQTAANAVFPRLYWVRDKNDQTLLSQAQMRERSDLKIAVLRPDRPVVLKCKPNLLTQQFLSGVTNAYTPVWNQWINTDAPTAPYYTWKWNIDNLTNTNYKVDVETIVYMSFKNVI